MPERSGLRSGESTPTAADRAEMVLTEARLLLAIRNAEGGQDGGDEQDGCAPPPLTLGGDRRPLRLREREDGARMREDGIRYRQPGRDASHARGRDSVDDDD